MSRDANRNSKFWICERWRYGTTAVKKAAIKKVNEVSVIARELRRKQERRKNEPVEDTITSDELVDMKFGHPDKIRNQFQERELETVLEIAVAKE